MFDIGSSPVLETLDLMQVEHNYGNRQIGGQKNNTIASRRILHAICIFVLQEIF